MKNFLLALTLLLAITSSAQRVTNLDLNTSAARLEAHKGVPTRCGGSANTQSADLEWQPILTKKITEIEHEGPDHEYIEKVKAEKLLLKQEYERTHTIPGAKTTAVTPAVGTNFAGNTYDFSAPLDNTIAISNGGKIVSVINSKINYYNSTGGSATYTNALTSFLPFTVSSVCDPVVIYDPERDRFVFFCQECPPASGSRIFLCFSKSNDPAAGWWSFEFPGDPTGGNDGFDYPKVALNDSEVFVTGNEYYPGGSFHQSVIFQFDKLAGYAGATVNFVYYTGITGSPFTILPTASPNSTNMTTGMVFVASRSGGGNTLGLFEVVGNWSGSPSLYSWVVPTTPYSIAASAYQLGTSTTLNTGDCRSLSGFFMNGFIHFVFNSDAGSGYNGINYNRMDVSGSAALNTSLMYGTSGFDNTYAAVASFTTSTTDKSVMIGYGRAGSSIYPEMRAVNCDNSGAWSSSTLVKSSASYAGSGGSYRWGDYTGISRKHNSTTPSVWMSGMYASSSNVWNTWIAEIHAGGSTSGIDDNKAEITPRLYPNPVYKDFSVDFALAENTYLSIAITDVSGRVVKELYNGKATAGENVFTFNKANLPAGTYFLNINSGNQKIKNEKIIIAD